MCEVPDTISPSGSGDRGQSSVPCQCEPANAVESSDAGNQKRMAWQACAVSVRGASHEHSGLPNQDACGFVQDSTVLAVADGHGSPKSFRSDVGARHAVNVALSVVAEFLANGKAPTETLSSIRGLAERHLPAELVREWRKMVDASRAQSPWTTEEKELLVSKGGETALCAVEENPYLAYGSTLLLVAATSRYIFYLQLGDGDILAVAPYGRDVSHPISTDPSLIANETTSLCMKDASRQFRFAFQAITDVPPPRLILLSTDGYANSFASPEAFEQAATDFIKIISEKGSEHVKQCLPSWLEESSREGSGDDVTVGLLWNDPVSINNETK